MKKYFVIVFVLYFSTFISSSNIPQANISNVVVSSDNITFDYNLKDIKEDIILDEDKYYSNISLYEEGILIKKIRIKEGKHSYTFSDLKKNHNYRIEINSPYDLLGYSKPYNENPYTLTSKNVTTLNDEIPSANIHKVNELNPTIVTDNKIAVNYDLKNQSPGFITKETAHPRLALYNDDGLLDIVNANEGDNNIHEFTDLVPGKYYVQVTGIYDMNLDGQADNQTNPILDREYFTVTDENVSGQIYDANVYSDYIKIKYNIENEFNDCRLIISDGTSQTIFAASGVGEASFYNLEENTQYNVSIEINGTVLDQKTYTTTILKDAPVAKIHGVSDDNPSLISNGDIKLIYDIIDLDNTIISAPEIVIYKDNEIIKTQKASEGFNQLFDVKDLTYGVYDVFICLDYDINGDNIKDNEDEKIELEKFYVDDSDQLYGNILLSSYADEDSIKIDYYLSAMNPNECSIHLKDTDYNETIANGKNTYTFENLEKGKNYIAVMQCENIILDQEAFNTGDLLKAPQVDINLPDQQTATIVGENFLKVNYDVSDEENALLINNENPFKIELYQNNQVLKSYDAMIGKNNSQLFENLEYGEYEVKISGSYDLNNDYLPDGNGILTTQTFTISEYKSIPSVKINSTIANNFSITAEYEIVDEDQVVQTASISNGFITYDAKSGKNNITFNNLKPNTDYQISISAEYDINGDSYIDEVISDSVTITTQDDVGYNFIRNCQDLSSIGAGQNSPGATHTDSWDYDENYILTNDIDCSNHDYIPINENFTGIIDGDGYSINNINISKNHSDNSLIAFNYGTIKNLDVQMNIQGGGTSSGLVSINYGLIQNVNVDINNTDHSQNTGAIAAINEGKITFSSSTGQVVGNSVGGLVGRNYGLIENSYSSAIIISKLIGGGLVGSNSGDIMHSFSNGDVTSTSAASPIGGFVGENVDGNISYSYSNSEVLGENAGGFVGYLINGLITSSYATGDTTGGSFVGEFSKDSRAQIINCFATGDSVYGFSKEKKKRDKYFIINSYAYDSARCSGRCNKKDIDLVKRDKLLNELWYDEVLNFNSKNWNYDLLENDYLPHVLNSVNRKEIPNQKNVGV